MTLEETVKTLERSNRRIKQLLAGLTISGIVLIAAAAASQATKTTTVEANRFVLRNQAGDEVGQWGTNADGVYFRIFDGSRKRFEIRTKPQGTKQREVELLLFGDNSMNNTTYVRLQANTNGECAVQAKKEPTDRWVGILVESGGGYFRSRLPEGKTKFLDPNGESWEAP